MSTYLIRNVQVFDGLDSQPGTHTILVSQGRLQYVGSSEPSSTPADANIIDGTGCTFLPGLIDAHVHVFRGVEEAKVALNFGVTTLLDMHNVPADALYMKQLSQESSDLPQIFSALYAATIADGWPRPVVRAGNPPQEVLESFKEWPELTTPESARAYVAANKKAGADFIKLMQENGECLVLGELPAPTLALQKAVVSEAQRHNLKTYAHATNLRDTKLVLEAGVEALAHQFVDQPHDQELLELYKQHNAFVVPTLVATSSLMNLDLTRNWLKQQNLGEDRLPTPSRNIMCECINMAKPGCSPQYAYDTIKALRREGIDVICGTDSGPIVHGTALGASIHQELQLYVSKCGFSPTEALRSATGISARRTGLEDRGRIAVGKRADCLLVRGDPTKNVERTMDIVHVWKEGVLHSPPQF